MTGRKLNRRLKNTLDWALEADERLIWLAEAEGLLWMQRELGYKRTIKGGLLNKACGVLAELTFRSMLDELNVPHTATEQILDKRHPVNVGRIYDFRLANGTTIDIKALPISSLNYNLNVNKDEAERIGVCDYYVLYKCKGMFVDHEYDDMRALDKRSVELGISYFGEQAVDESIKLEFNQVKAKLEKYLYRMMLMDFVAYTEGGNLVKPENLKNGDFGPYYSLKVPDNLTPPFRSYKDFAVNVLHSELL
jgi:hypothetical protein